MLNKITTPKKPIFCSKKSQCLFDIADTSSPPSIAKLKNYLTETNCRPQQDELIKATETASPIDQIGKTNVRVRADNSPLPFYFFVQGTTTQKRIIFHLFHFFRLQLFVARRHITRNRFPFFTRFRTLDNHCLPGHVS